MNKRTFWLLIIVFVLLGTPLGLVLVIWKGNQIADNTIAKIGVGFCISLIALIIFLDAFGRYQLLKNDLLKGWVLSIDGEVRRYNNIRFRGQNIIRIKNVAFNIVELGIPLAIHSGQNYRIYYVPFSRTIVSAESLVSGQPIE